MSVATAPARKPPAPKTPLETGTGVVKWFNDKNAFGFLTFDDREPKDIFVHITAVQEAGFESLTPGQRFAFSIETSRRHGKPYAVNLKVI